MAAVIGFKGRSERFTRIDHTRSSSDRENDVRLHVNKVVSSSDGCHFAKTCRLTGYHSNTPTYTADETSHPGYVIKASVSGRNMRVFVNVCKKESIHRPLPAKQDADGGFLWTIPHALTEQVNGSRETHTCRVFDFQVHPETCRMAETNRHFKSMLNELAVAAVDDEFDVHVNARKLQFPKMKYKEVIGSKTWKTMSLGNSMAAAEVSDNFKVTSSKIKNSQLMLDSNNAPNQKSELHAIGSIDPDNNKFIVPNYTVKFSRNEEMPVVNGVMFSQVLVANIELPMLTSALGINLDLFEKKLCIATSEPARYKLDVDLPHVIDENHSFAKFIKARKLLQITMPVITSSSLVCKSGDTVDSDEKLASDSAVNVVHSPQVVSGVSVTSSDVDDASLLDRDDEAESDSVFSSGDMDSHIADTFLGEAHVTTDQQLATSACSVKDPDSQCTQDTLGISESNSAAPVELNSLDDTTVIDNVEKLHNDRDVSSDIVVVHEKGIPKLHGILKQRTMSESSDDYMRTCSSPSDRQLSAATVSEGDEPEDGEDWSTVPTDGSARILKKSVSFNDRIDHTVFQANQSVSSMHAALKNRRRRARKRDQKQEQMQQRRRRRSSGSFSMEESGDEQVAGSHAVRVRAGKDHKHSRVASSPETIDRSSDVAGNKGDRSDRSFVAGCVPTATEKAIITEEWTDSQSSVASGVSQLMHLSNDNVESDMKVTSGSSSDDNVAQPLAERTTSCVSASPADIVKFCHSVDTDRTVSIGECFSQSSDKVAVPSACSQFHLDVD